MSFSKAAVLIFCLSLCLAATAAPPHEALSTTAPTATMVIDNSTYIDANKILMFVTNHGNFGRDLAGLFGYDYGTFYPYIDTSYITAGVLSDQSPLYAAGLWFGGQVGGETRIAISEYSDEYVPGPMSGGTYMPDDPSFRVYKLYADSLLTNPNDDYNNWPVSQGAPLDDQGHPLCRGDQTLWTVFNDADLAAHSNDAGETDPLGIEVRQLTWAADEAGTDPIPGTTQLLVHQYGTTETRATVTIADTLSLTGHNYMIVIDSSETLGTVWHLWDQTLGTPILYYRSMGVAVTIDGLDILVQSYATLFESFEVVANGAGVVDPPLPGAMASAGFPTPGDADPGVDQQVGLGKWLFHTGDNGGTSGGGTRGSFDAFITRVLRGDPVRIAQVGKNDFEMRFTGSPGNPGVNGSWAWEWATDGSSYWVPFELWRIGVGTPDDPSDDVRLLPFIYGDGDTEYDMSSYGSALLANCGPMDCEHSVSGGDDDPYMDWVYWRIPGDSTAGEAGYLAYEADMMSDPTNHVDDATPIIDRTVLVNWNGGLQPADINMDMPEQGTVFRIRTKKETPYDTFTFTATPLPEITTGDEGVYVYQEYWVHNKGGNTIEDCYFSLWADPDLGTAGDDLVGCDTLNDIFFCYNAANNDNQYGTPPPAMGFKYLVGPIVPYPGETADFFGEPWSNHKDLGMTAFSKFINGTDPDNFTQTYGFMRGLTKAGLPYVYNGDTLTYVHSGDPVAGTGDLDSTPDDRRMLASSGGFTLNPGDSMYCLIRLAARHGADNLDAITELTRILNLPFDISTGVSGGGPAQLPEKFSVSQNYPNPFNPSTTIEYALPERAKVTIDVYNILGQKVRRLIDKTMPAGVHTTVWNGTNNSGEAVSTGLYFYRVRAGDNIDQKKMLLLK